MQLFIDAAVARLLFLGHVAELGEDDRIRLGKRIHAHMLTSVRFTRAAHAEIGVDQQQRFHRQILKLQIPR